MHTSDIVTAVNEPDLFLHGLRTTICDTTMSYDNLTGAGVATKWREGRMPGSGGFGIVSLQIE